MPVNHTLSGSVRIDDAFWSPKLRTFFDVTVPDTFDKLEKDGVIENYRSLIAGNLGTHKICPWHDGLLLEAIRGMASRGIAVIFITHRLQEILSVCDRVVVMYEGKCMGVLENKELTEEKLMAMASGYTV